MIVSSMVPPNFVTNLISFKSTFVATAGSMTLSTESTAIGESKAEYCDTIFELSEVEAARNKLSRSLRSNLVEISVRYSVEIWAALVKLSAIVVGWIPAHQSQLFTYGQ